MLPDETWQLQVGGREPFGFRWHGLDLPGGLTVVSATKTVLPTIGLTVDDPVVDPDGTGVYFWAEALVPGDYWVTINAVRSDGGKKVALARITVPETVALGAELLVDGGFEFWDTAHTLTNWFEFGLGTSTVNREDTDHLPTGSHAIRLDVDAADDFVGFRSQAGNWPDLQPGKRYRLTTWRKMSGPVGRAAIYIGSTNPIPLYLGDTGLWNNIGGHHILANVGVWTRDVLDFEGPPPGYSEMRIYVVNLTAPSISIYFDDFSLREILA